MAKLTGKQRNKLPKSKFAMPGKRAYPIDTKARARNALARVSQHGTKSQQKKVRAAVTKKFPSLKKTGGSRKKK
jgi:predicted DNA-binding helix-hairpin-helix protein